jgi:hypothetical protein
MKDLATPGEREMSHAKPDRVSGCRNVHAVGDFSAGARLGGARAPAVGPGAPAPASRFEFREIAVRIPARGLDLEGTLAVPRARGPRPAVVLVQGSGPLGRDEVLPGQLGMMFGFEGPDLPRARARPGGRRLRRHPLDKRTCTAKQGCDNRYPEADVGFDDVSSTTPRPSSTGSAPARG